MAIHRTRRDKENPHYGFLVSWTPDKARVKREHKIESASYRHEPKTTKSANLSEKEGKASFVKKDIIRSLIVVGIILTLEMVVYLAWNRFR